MKSKIKHYWQVYLEFLRISFAHASQFRLHFILLILMDIVFYGTTLYSISIIYNFVGYIKIWDKHQFLFFTVFSLVVDQIITTFTSESYWGFAILLRKGDFDFLLLKPLHTIFLSLFRHIRPGTMCNVFITVPALIYFGIQVKLSFLAWVMLPFLLLFASALQISLDILLLSSIFWTLEGRGINLILLELQNLSSWPNFIYPATMQRALIFVLPILLINSAPVRWLYNISDVSLMFFAVIAIVVLSFLIRLVWHWGTRAYESASS